MIRRLAEQPRRVFLYDGLGAMLSAILYGLVLANLESFFGISADLLYILCGLALLYAIFSFSSYILKIKNWRTFLRIIGIANLAHCFVVTQLLYFYQTDLTLWGAIFIALDILVIASIGIIEINIANKANVNRSH